MRSLKWVGLAAIVVAVVATALYLRRDYLAQNIANSVLGGQDLIVTELSVDALTPSRLDLAKLVVESASGARYAAAGLSVPLAASGVRLDQIRADSLTVTFHGDQATRSLLSTTLGKILELPHESETSSVSEATSTPMTR